MKLYKFWIGIILSVVVFFYTAGITVKNSPTYIETQDYNALYFNGYLNFTFNGITKLFTGDKLKNNVEDSFSPQYGYVVNNKNSKDIDKAISPQDTIQDKLEVAVNNIVRNIVGKDLRDIHYEIESLPNK